MQKGLTSIRPVQVLGSVANPQPTDTRQVLIFNPSGVNIWLADDQESANANTGVPVQAGQQVSFLWNNSLWIGADIDNTEFRYMVSAHFAGKSQSFAELRKATPPPPIYYNRPA